MWGDTTHNNVKAVVLSRLALVFSQQKDNRLESHPAAKSEPADLCEAVSDRVETRLIGKPCFCSVEVARRKARGAVGGCKNCDVLR